MLGAISQYLNGKAASWLQINDIGRPVGFDGIACFYDWLDRIASGKKMQQCRCAFLNETVQAQEVLLIGEGTGRFLLDFLRSNAKANITCVDSSRRMLQLAQKRLKKNGVAHVNVKFVHADILNWPVENKHYDLVATNFFLDCFSEKSLERVISKIASVTKTEAVWLVSDFRKPHDGLTGLRASFILKSLYVFFRFATGLEARSLTPPDRALKQNGFVLVKQKQFDWGLFQSTIWNRAHSL